MWAPNDWTPAPDAQPEPDWVKWVGGGPPTPPLEREREPPSAGALQNKHTHTWAACEVNIVL